ncbi:hypothetical protein ABZ348_26615 [Streptomyces sp. NPDC005963]
MTNDSSSWSDFVEPVLLGFAILAIRDGRSADRHEFHQGHQVDVSR